MGGGSQAVWEVEEACDPQRTRSRSRRPRWLRSSNLSLSPDLPRYLIPSGLT